MSTWIDKNDCLETLNYYKKICNSEDEAYEKTAESLNISTDRLLEIIDEEET